MSGFQQWCWPDGLSYLEQENLVSEAFQIMKAEAEKELAKQNNG